jgi:hypothetical protein
METPTVAESPPAPAPEPAPEPEPAPTSIFAEPPPAVEEAVTDLPLPTPSIRRTPRDSGGGWFMPLVFMPLVLYAIGASFFVGWSVWKVNQLTTTKEEQNPFDKLIDDGEDQGVRRPDGKKVLFKVSYPERFVTAPLPPEQRLRLNETRRFGSIEVTPLRVERKKVGVFVQGFGAEPCKFPSLVLHLKFRNVSEDQTFAPLDNYFDRWWKPGQGQMPFTQLEAGKDRFCGGPAKWNPPLNKKNEKPQWVEGRKPSDPEGLKPGEEAEGFVCTDGDDARAALVLFADRQAAADLFGGPGRVPPPSAGPFLWRVQMRRGLINWKGKDHSATTVIGVEFGRDDIG